jgi:hypothetical protein
MVPGVVLGTLAIWGVSTLSGSSGEGGAGTTTASP